MRRGIGLIEGAPYLGFHPHPPADTSCRVSLDNGSDQMDQTRVVVILVPEPLGHLLLAGLVRVEVKSVQHGQGLLGVSMLKIVQ